MKWFFNKKISTKIMVIVVAILVFTAVSILGIVLLEFNDYSEIMFNKITSNSLNSLDSSITDFKTKALETASVLANDSSIITYKDEASLLASLQKYSENFDCDNITYIDKEGNVIIRTKNPDSKGDNIGAQYSVTNAINGTSTANVETDSEHGLIVRACVPVKNLSQQIFGIISVEYYLNDSSFLDILKEQNDTEFTIFSNDVRLNTTIMKDGKRMTGTKASESVAKKVLVQKESFFGEANILGEQYISAYMPIYDGASNPIGILFAGVSLAEKDASIQTIITTILIVLGITILLCIFLLFLFIKKTIKKPITKLIGVAEKIADGDLNVTITSDSKDEIGKLANTFSKMSNHFNDFMTQIYSVAEQVTEGSKQVANSSTTLSQGSTEQASAIEQLSASIEEISSQTKANATNATNANLLSNEAKTKAVEGNNQMTNMIAAMEDINISSSDIYKIIKVIDDIAFQTNMLALNAAIEAARAGQYGRGFAVVAEEVRSLAARSADAAKETTELIETSIQKVNAGTKIAKNTAVSLTEIVEGATKVASLVENIATASNEQTIGIEQINQGILQVSQVVQSNSVTSEESAAASEELAGQAELLKSKVSEFKLKTNND